MSGQSRDRLRHLMALAVAILSSWKLITFATVLAGAVTYGILWLQPRYTSTTLLAMDEETAQRAESIMRSAAITESVLVKFPDVGETHEQRKRYLQKNLRIPAAVSGRAATLYEMLVTHRDPAVAQHMASDLLDRWLELTKPRPVRKAELETDLARYEALDKELTSLLSRLGSESPTLIYPDNLHGELATSIHALAAKRDQSQKEIAKIKALLRGTPRDVIVIPPNLPSERSNSAGWPALLVSCLVLLLMLACIGIRRVLLPQWRGRLSDFRQIQIDRKRIRISGSH